MSMIPNLTLPPAPLGPTCTNYPLASALPESADGRCCSTSSNDLLKRCTCLTHVLLTRSEFNPEPAVDCCDMTRG